MSRRLASAPSRRAAPRGACLIGLVVTTLSCLVGPAATGQESPPSGVTGQPPPFPRVRVLVVDGRDYRIDPDALFHPPDQEPPTPTELARLADEAATILAREPELEVLRIPDLAPRNDPGSPEIVVRGLLHLGLERYKDIRIPAAIGVLEQGVTAALADYLDLFAPELVSDLYLYLGLSHLENGSGALAHVAFKSLFAVTPWRRFPQGYFPPDTETAIRSAAVDFLRTYPKETLMGTAERTLRFMSRHRIAVGCYVLATGADDRDSRVEIRIVEGPTRGRPAVGLGTMGGFALSGHEDASERVSRMLTAWAACADLPSREPRVTRKPRFFMDTSAAYALFLKVPTRRLFHNAGFGLGLAWQAAEGLDVFGRLNIFNAFPDPFGDLISDFWSIRGVVGVGYSLVGDWGRVFVHTGLDVNYLSDFASTTDPQCKFWPDDPSRCAASRIKRPSYLVGINGAVGVNVRLAGPISLIVQTGFTGYFFSNNKTPDINFPFMLEAGLGYAFF